MLGLLLVTTLQLDPLLCHMDPKNAPAISTARPTNVPSSKAFPVGLLGGLDTFRLTIPLADGGTVVLGVDGCGGGTWIGKGAFMFRTGELAGVGCRDLRSCSSSCSSSIGGGRASVAIRKGPLVVGVGVTVDEPEEFEVVDPLDVTCWPSTTLTEDVLPSSGLRLSLICRLPRRSRTRSFPLFPASRSLPLA